MKYLSFIKISYCICVFILLWGISCQAASYRAVDNIAKNIKDYPNIVTLTRELTKRFNAQEEKARAIYAWIIYHIDYDWYKADAIEKHRQLEQTEDIFKTRTGVCGDIAKLYQKMAQIAGLECEVISGYAGFNVTKKTMDNALHAWNVVKINNKWHLVDATWGIQGGRTFGQDIKTDSQYRRQLKKRNLKKYHQSVRDRFIDNRYFMADPSVLIDTHFPHDEKWQLIRPPQKLKSFLKR